MGYSSKLQPFVFVSRFMLTVIAYANRVLYINATYCRRKYGGKPHPGKLFVIGTKLFQGNW